MEITKCPPLRRKVWAFRATIRVWSGWATSAKITSTIAREKQVVVKSWIQRIFPAPPMGPAPQHQQVPGRVFPASSLTSPPLIPLPPQCPQDGSKTHSHTTHSFIPLVNRVATYSVASPGPGVGDRETSQTRTLPSRRSRVWGGRQTRHQKDK